MNSQELSEASLSYLADPVMAPEALPPVQRARERVRRESHLLGGRPPQLPEVTDLEVAGSDDNPAVPARLYRSDGAAGILVYFHGGGFIGGGIDTVDIVARRIAVRSGWNVLSVAYRLAPEDPFPAARDDALSAVRWALSNGDGGPVAVGGESAGGNLATVAARKIQLESPAALVAQVLVYPVTACRNTSASLARYSEGFGLSAERIQWYWEQYLPATTAPHDPDVSPLGAPDAESLPPTLVMVAGCDPLRSDGEDYAAHLASVGVRVHCEVFEGSVHGFFRLAGAFPEETDHADRLVGDWLRDAASQASSPPAAGLRT